MIPPSLLSIILLPPREFDPSTVSPFPVRGSGDLLATEGSDEVAADSGGGLFGWSSGPEEIEGRLSDKLCPEGFSNNLSLFDSIEQDVAADDEFARLGKDCGENGRSFEDETNTSDL